MLSSNKVICKNSHQIESQSAKFSGEHAPPYNPTESLCFVLCWLHCHYYTDVPLLGKTLDPPLLGLPKLRDWINLRTKWGNEVDTYAMHLQTT